MFAIPAVLKRGKEISGHPDHKGRGYDTVTIAAKILINDAPGVVAAVVTKIDGKNQYRVHRIITSDGSEYVFKNKDAQPTSGEPSSNKDERAPIGSASIDSIPDSTEKVNTFEEETLSEKERELISEWNAHASAEKLGGDESFVDKLIRENTGLAQKMLNHIKDLAKAFERMGDPAARAEYQRLKKAENLFLKAVSKAGGQYVNGKIVMRREEEESDYENETLSNFGIERIGDYIHVQRKVFDTLLQENFFTNVETRSRIDVNEETGMVIETNKRGIFETFSLNTYGRLGKSKKLAKLATIKDLPNAIKYGHVVTGSVRNVHHNGKNKVFAYIEYPTKINGKEIVIKLAIKKSPQKSKFWVHSIYDIKSVSDSSTSTQKGTEADHITADNTEIISQDSDYVKSKSQFSRKSSPQQAKDTANRNKKKVYTKKDARSIIRTVVGEQLGFGVSNNIAEYLLQTATIESIYEADDRNGSQGALRSVYRTGYTN